MSSHGLKRLDTNLVTTGSRTYKSRTLNYKRITELVAWTQRRCIICKRFLSRKQQKYCNKCFKIENLKYRVQWNREKVARLKKLNNSMSVVQ